MLFGIGELGLGMDLHPKSQKGKCCLPYLRVIDLIFGNGASEYSAELGFKRHETTFLGRKYW